MDSETDVNCSQQDQLYSLYDVSCTSVMVKLPSSIN